MKIKHIFVILIVILLLGCAKSETQTPSTNEVPNAEVPTEALPAEIPQPPETLDEPMLPEENVEPIIPVEQTSEPQIEQRMEAIVEIDGRFDPKELTVKAGTTVIFRNNHPTAVQVIKIKELNVKSDRIEPSQTWSYMFDTPGTYNYFSVIYTALQGKIIVEP